MPSCIKMPGTPPLGELGASIRVSFPFLMVNVVGSFGRETLLPLGGTLGIPGIGRFNSPVYVPVICTIMVT